MKAFKITYRREDGALRIVPAQGQDSKRAAIEACVEYRLEASQITLIQAA